MRSREHEGSDRSKITLSDTLHFFMSKVLNLDGETMTKKEVDCFNFKTIKSKKSKFDQSKTLSKRKLDQKTLTNPLSITKLKTATEIKKEHKYIPKY